MCFVFDRGHLSMHECNRMFVAPHKREVPPPHTPSTQPTVANLTSQSVLYGPDSKIVVRMHSVDMLGPRMGLPQLWLTSDL